MTLATRLPYSHPFAGGYPRIGGQPLPTDPDAIDYLARVAAVEGAAVEQGVAMAVDAFVKGCKADGIWDAIKASCIMAGARTLTGALVPLVGTAPTPYNFASADYDRSTGLKGDGSSTYLDSGRDSSDDPKDDCHLCVYETTSHTGTAFGASIGGFDTATPSQKVIFYRDSTLQIVGRLNNVDATSFTRPSATAGFTGVSRNSGSGLTLRYAGSDNAIAQPSVTMANRNISVFSQDTGAGQSNHTNARLAFYSIGSAIPDLAALDARVSALMRDIQFFFNTGLSAANYNAESVDWANRVYANGGSVSASTMSAASTFCNAIDASGLRDRYYRLNLFCGNNLSAALVPLYRGPTFGGAVYGNATDTNNAFVGVGTDYAETGAGGGLTGNGTTKYLNTGLSVSDIGTFTSGHLSVYHGQSSGNNSNRYYIAANDSVTSNRFWLGTDAFSTAQVQAVYGATLSAVEHLASQAHGTAGHRIASRTSTTLLTHYHNGSVVATNTSDVTGGGAASTAALPVFAYNNNGSISRFHNSWIAGYSIGLGLDSTQAAAYRTAMQAFQTAMGRNV